MRLRTPVVASALAASACAAAPAVAAAAPQHNHALDIYATPSHIVAGDSVLVFGQLAGPNNAHREITLYRHWAGQKGFSVAAHARTNAQGRYEFPRAAHYITTNRSWFVRGPGSSHSRTVHEQVAPELTLSASTSNGTTARPIDFHGTVSPGNVGSRVALQVHNGVGNSWATIATGRVGVGGKFSIMHSFPSPGPRNVRVRFLGDSRNSATASDPVSVVVNQRQSPYFTLQSARPVLPVGATTTISGVLKKAHTSVAESGVTVALYARVPHAGTPFALVTTTTTAANGAYSFTVGGTTNELYQARVLGKGGKTKRESAMLFQGVQNAVSLNPSAQASTVGGSVTFTGIVSPDSTGHAVLLEYLGRDHHWQVATTSTVAAGSTFSISWKFGFPGTKHFRVRVAGGPDNIGGVSAPVTITVAQPTLSSLPTH
jgi:hypothetical protein